MVFDSMQNLCRPDISGRMDQMVKLNGNQNTKNVASNEQLLVKF